MLVCNRPLSQEVRMLTNVTYFEATIIKVKTLTRLLGQKEATGASYSLTGGKALMNQADVR